MYYNIIILFLYLFWCVHSQGSKEITIGYSNKALIKVQKNTDVHKQIQESLNNLRTNGGGILRFEDGLYLLSSNIEVGSNVSIIGGGINNTILKLVDKAKPWWIPEIGYRKAGFINSEDTENLYFAHFTIDGNKENQNTDEYSVYGRFGLYTETVDNIRIDSMGIINFQGYGFDPHGVKDPKEWSVGLSIVNSYAFNNDWDGFTIDQSANVLLYDNVAYNNGRHGFNIVTGTYNLIMTNNIAYDNGFYFYLGDKGCGIAIQNNLDYGTRDISVVNNLFQNNSDAGICLRDVSDIKIINNLIVNINYTDAEPRQCIEIFNSADVENKNNSCSDELLVPFVKIPVIKNVLNISSVMQQSSASGKVSVSLIVVLLVVTVSMIII